MVVQPLEEETKGEEALIEGSHGFWICGAIAGDLDGGLGRLREAGGEFVAVRVFVEEVF